MDAVGLNLGERGWERNVTQFGHGSGKLHAGGAAADDGDVELPGISGHAPGLKLVYQLIAEHYGVAPGVHAVGVLGRPGYAEECRADARGQYEVVVSEHRSVTEQELALIGVDTADLALPESSPRLADRGPRRVGDVRRGQARRRYLIKERLEGAVRVAVDQRDAHAHITGLTAPAPACTGQLGELIDRIQPGEPGADHHDPNLTRGIGGPRQVRSHIPTVSRAQPMARPASRWAM